MAILLRKKPKPLTFGQQVQQAVKGIVPPPRFKQPLTKVPKIELSGARQSTLWTLSAKAGGRSNGLSVSSVEMWLDCKEQFRMEKAEGFRSRDGSAAIDFGEWWHFLLGRHYAARSKDQGLETAARLFKAQYLRDNPNCTEKRLEALELGFLKTIALWPVYLEKFAEEDAGREWIGIEKDFEFGYSLPGIPHPAYQPRTGLVIAGESILDPPHVKDKSISKEVLMAVEGCIVNFRGIMDGVYRWNGRLWLFETKTKSRIDEEEIEDTMKLDFQVMSYLYAIYRKYKEWPAGVQYNVIRNPQTAPGKRNAETQDEFVERLEKDVRKDEDHYFKRWEMEVSKEEIEEFVEKQFDPILRDIQGWAYGHHPHYVHTKALVGKYGKCRMYDPITKGDFTGVDRVEVPARKER